MEFSGLPASHLLGCLGTLWKQLNTVISVPYIFTTHRVLSLGLTYGNPAVIGPGLWACLGTVTVGGDLREATRKRWDTPHPSNAMLPVILSLQCGLAPGLTQS